MHDACILTLICYKFDFSAQIISTNSTPNDDDEYAFSYYQHYARRQLSMRDEWGNTVLIATAFLRPPRSVVQALLHVSAVVLPHDDWRTLRARDGSTALQVACATGAHPCIVADLLALSPHRPNNRRISQNDTGGHLFSSLTYHMDHGGGTPLTDLVIQYTLERKAPQYARTMPPPLEDMPWNPVRDDVVNTCSDIPPQQTFCYKVQCLLQAHWNEQQQHDCHNVLALPSLLHAAADAHFACPPLLWNVMVQRWWKPAVATRDGNGRLPLHLALQQQQQPPTTLHDDNTDNNNDDYSWTLAARMAARQRQAHAVRTLVEAYPDAVHVPLPLSCRLPVTQAVAIGLPWNECLANLYQKSMSPEENENDPVTGLPLFALAATSIIGHENPLMGLTNTYHLLRQTPEAALRYR